MPAYSKTTWVNGTTPAINATNLNKIEQGIADAVRKDGSEAMSAQLVTIAGTAATPAIAPTGDSNTGIFFPAADTIAFGEGGAEAMRITSAGNVGIGTTSPNVSGLEISRATGSATPTPAEVRISTTSNASDWSTTDPWGRLSFYSADASNGGAKIQASVETICTATSGGTSALRLNVTDGQATPALVNGLTILSTASANPNVGIGTTSPLSKLHVAGPSGVTTVTGTSVLGLTITAPASTSDLFGIDFTNGTNLPAARIAAKRGATGSEMYFGISNLYASGITNQAMMIDFNGFLLVGYTTSNGAYPLQVNGQIFATSSTIATSDGRYKKDVVALDGALDIVSKLNPVQFSWKEHPVHKFNTDVPTVGFIAQEVAEVLKDKAYLTSLIKKSECTWETETGETVEREVTRDVETQVEREITEEIDGEEVTRTVTETVIEQVTEIVTEPVKETHTEEFLGIAESNMIAILTKAIQELKAEVDALKAQLNGN